MLPKGERQAGSCQPASTGGISIHAPRGGSDQSVTAGSNSDFTFQSTLPVGGATIPMRRPIIPTLISIHAPRGGSDWRNRWDTPAMSLFQSTLPVGGATITLLELLRYLRFQSTLPVGGATRTRFCRSSTSFYFNPRSPWGERRRGGAEPDWPDNFNPRSPWGERPLWYGCNYSLPNFNPRSPWGERPTDDDTGLDCLEISIHAPRGGSDLSIIRHIS